MDISIAGNDFLIFSVLVFVCVLLLVEGLFAMWRAHKGPEVTRLKRRLQGLAATSDRTAQTQVLKQRLLSETPGLERFIQRLPRLHQFDRFLLQSGLNWTVSGVLLASLLGGIAAWVAVSAFAAQVRLLGTVAALAGASLPFVYVSWRRGRRLRHIERQLPDTLDLMTRALRAGHAFTSALSMAGNEMPEPVGGEFRLVHDEINFGVSMQQALTHLSERVPLTDLRYFVVAVLIQRDSGGNLTEILTELSALLRQRAKLMAKIRVLSSEGRLSAWILGLMPFALAAVMNLVNPKFMSLLWTDPLGIAMVRYMLVLMLFGALIMRKIVRIRV